MVEEIAIPGSVWDDFLSPDVSNMESELGLRDLRATPFYRRRGKGGSHIYVDVPNVVAVELGEYLYDRADTLLGQSIDDPYDPFEKASRATYRRAMQLGETLQLVALAGPDA